MTALPAAYAWLDDEPYPNVLKQMLKLYGTQEAPGDADNPVILGWARELGLTDYRHDSEAWCGLGMAIAVHRAGYMPPAAPLWAQNWLQWGTPVAGPPMLGDVLVFRRTVKGEVYGHVGDYVGEDETHFHVLGANQSDQVNIKRLTKATFTRGMPFGFAGARRTPWKIAEPPNIRRVFLSPDGVPTGGSVA